MNRRNRSITVLVAIVIACWLVTSIRRATASADERRFASGDYDVAFQPPRGWSPDILVEYVGPRRQDGTRATLDLTAQDSLVDLSEQGINGLADNLVAQFTGEGIEEAQIIGRRKTSISGMDAFQLDMTYKQEGVPMHLRHVYIPVAQHNRTYLFTLVDNADAFNQTAADADNAIASFGLIQAKGESSGPAASDKQSILTLALIVTGALALAVVIGSVYLLLRSRAAGAQS